MSAIATPLIDQTSVQALLAAARPSYSKWLGSSVGWVNWRKDSCQIKIVYDDMPSFAVFVDFKFANTSSGVPYRLRDEVLRALHKRHSSEPATMSNNGYMHYCFVAKDKHISVQEVLDLADTLPPQGVEICVYYMQESPCVRPYFEMLGRALVVGECGLKWFNGELSGHRTEDRTFL